MKQYKLAPPWETYKKKILTLFEKDPDVIITYSYTQNIHTLKLFVSNEEKAEALSQLLPTCKNFGGVVLQIIVVPANLKDEEKITVFQKAFDGNPIVKDFLSDDVFGFNYVVFENKVVQFYNDQMDDPNGLCSTLYQDIAKEVFENHDGIFFCTEKAPYIEQVQE